MSVTLPSRKVTFVSLYTNIFFASEIHDALGLAESRGHLIRGLAQSDRGRLTNRSACIGRRFLLGLVGFFRLLVQRSNHLALRRRRRRVGGDSGLGWGGLRGSRSRWQSAFALLLLQVLHALVDGLPHMVLHFLQVLQINGNYIALGTFLPALTCQNRQIDGCGIRRILTG